ncbi:hypothetical protein RhiirC2_761707 [Rhizophagus irregularis]|uniref:Uncharacterized protein n=1 Tax=Rhizophagus irregularis TaxID=588596 RepID=A0A2N1MFV6_9GLOM|nr:hypothetical protein RhiirC2_761707 [Rhizophagus irregularis]
MAVPSRYSMLTIANFVIYNTTAITRETNYPFPSFSIHGIILSIVVFLGFVR